MLRKVEVEVEKKKTRASSLFEQSTVFSSLENLHRLCLLPSSFRSQKESEPWASLTSSRRRTARYVLCSFRAQARESEKRNSNELMAVGRWDDDDASLEAFSKPRNAPRFHSLPVDSFAGWHHSELFYDWVEFWSQGRRARCRGSFSSAKADDDDGGAAAFFVLTLSTSSLSLTLSFSLRPLPPPPQLPPPPPPPLRRTPPPTPSSPTRPLASPTAPRSPRSCARPTRPQSRSST